jgi:CheY-like chemotaxis protein
MSQLRMPITILMADDDPDDHLLTWEAFEETKLTHDLRFVKDGEELMDYLYRRGQYTDPNLSPQPGVILANLNMPRKDGCEALIEIKSDPKLRIIPIVILTTSKAEEDILNTYNLGASSFITKPATFDKLIDTVYVLGKYWSEIAELPLKVS